MKKDNNKSDYTYKMWKAISICILIIIKIWTLCIKLGTLDRIAMILGGMAVFTTISIIKDKFEIVRYDPFHLHDLMLIASWGMLVLAISDSKKSFLWNLLLIMLSDLSIILTGKVIIRKKML